MLLDIIADKRFLSQHTTSFAYPFVHFLICASHSLHIDSFASNDAMFVSAFDFVLSPVARPFCHGLFPPSQLCASGEKPQFFSLRQFMLLDMSSLTVRYVPTSLIGSTHCFVTRL